MSRPRVTTALWIAAPLLLAAAVAAGVLILTSPDDAGPAPRADPRLAERARLAFDRAEYESALALACAALDRHPDSAEAHAIAGRCLALPGLRDSTKAIDHLERAARLGTDDEEALVALAELEIRRARLTGRGGPSGLGFDRLLAPRGETDDIDRVILLARCDMALSQFDVAVGRLREASWRDGGLPEEARFLLARARWRRGEVSLSRKTILELVEETRNPVLLLRAAEFAFQLGDPKLGERILARAGERFPGRALVVLARSRWILDARPAEEREKELRQRVAAKPGDADASLALAELLLTSPDPDGREEDRISEARALIGDAGPEARLALALWRVRSGSPGAEEALARIAAIGAGRPDDPRLHLHLANLYRLRREVAREVFELNVALRAAPRTPALLLRRADALIRAGRLDAAAVDIKLAGQSPESLRLLARTQLDRVSPDADKALVCLDLAAELSGGVDRPPAAVDRVRALRLSGQDEEALTLGRALAKSLRGHDLRIDLAAELGRLGETALLDRIVTERPDSIRARLTRAALQRDADEVRAVLEVDPTNLVALRLLYVWEPSAELVERAEAIDPTAPETCFVRGRQAQEDGRPADAAADLLAALAAEPRDREAAGHLAIALADADDPALEASALTSFGRGAFSALENDRLPLEAGLLLLRAERAAAEGDSEARLAACRRLKDLRPNDVEVRIALASALLDAGKTEEAAAEIPDDPRAVALKGRLLEANGDADGARAAYEAALAAEPGRPDALDGLARVGKLDRRAFGTLVTAQFERPGISPANAAECVLRLVEIDVLEAHYAAALARVRAWARVPLAPPVTTALIHFQGGLAAEEIGRPAEAEEHYAASLRHLPDHVPALNNLALLFAGDSKSAHHGLTVAKRAATLAPGLAEIRDTLATALLATGDREGAIREYRAASELFRKRGDKGKKELDRTLARLAELIGAVGEDGDK
jgi:tetratricopeptide (TPR) repeat protein